MYPHHCKKVKMMGKVWFYAFLLYFEGFSGGCEFCEFETLNSKKTCYLKFIDPICWLKIDNNFKPTYCTVRH